MIPLCIHLDVEARRGGNTLQAGGFDLSCQFHGSINLKSDNNWNCSHLVAIVESAASKSDYLFSLYFPMASKILSSSFVYLVRFICSCFAFISVDWLCQGCSEAPEPFFFHRKTWAKWNKWFNKTEQWRNEKSFCTKFSSCHKTFLFFYFSRFCSHTRLHISRRKKKNSNKKEAIGWKNSRITKQKT